MAGMKANMIFKLNVASTPSNLTETSMLFLLRFYADGRKVLASSKSKFQITYRTWLYILSLQTLTDHLQNSSDTVDRRNPAPVDMENCPLFTRFVCIAGGAGFLASTVSQQLMEKSTIHPKKQSC